MKTLKAPRSAKSPNTKFQCAWEEDAVVVRLPVKRTKDWSQYVLLNSDRHFDNPGSDQAMIKRHLTEAEERDAIVMDFGDFFCAMQGKYDKRSNKDSLRPEHQRGDYLDSLVETGFELLQPYADRVAMMSMGNHETSIADRHETNLTERLVGALRMAGGQTVRHKYSGFTRFFFSDHNGANFSQSFVMWHTHGYGGGGPVTKDIIQTNRQGVFLDGVDIVVSGHTHDAWTFPVATRRLGLNNRIMISERLHIKIPSAKEKWGKSSWEDERGMPPKVLGAYWLKFSYCRRTQEIVVDAERAR